MDHIYRDFVLRDRCGPDGEQEDISGEAPRHEYEK